MEKNSYTVVLGQEPSTNPLLPQLPRVPRDKWPRLRFLYFNYSNHFPGKMPTRPQSTKLQKVLGLRRQGTTYKPGSLVKLDVLGCKRGRPTARGTGLLCRALCPHVTQSSKGPQRLVKPQDTPPGESAFLGERPTVLSPPLHPQPAGRCQRNDEKGLRTGPCHQLLRLPRVSAPRQGSRSPSKSLPLRCPSQVSGRAGPEAAPRPPERNSC